MLEIITVVFAQELPLLKIQAHSIQQYINDVERITIVINDNTNVASMIDTQWWGKWHDKVRIVTRDKWKYSSRLTGWEEQQLLKLLAASEAIAPWSMVLDAKTWFKQMFDSNGFFDEQGRPKTGAIRVFPVFESSQKFIEKYYNMTMPDVLGPAGVPFMFHSETVRGLVNGIDDFIEFFQTNVKYPNLITEFHLYSGYVIAQFGSYEALYNLTPRYNVLNIADYEADRFDQMLTEAETLKRLLTVSIHRKTYKLLSESQIQRWVKFLLDNRIITNEQETISLLNTL